jgi:hypothetical protein
MGGGESMNVMVPAWIQTETKEGVFAVLGSEPSDDAQPVWLPRKCVTSCVVTPEELAPARNGRRFGVLMLDGDELPPAIRKALSL